MTEFSPFSCPIFLGHPEASGFCFQSERLLYRREPRGVRAEPGKQKPRSCRTQELARSSAQENEWEKREGAVLSKERMRGGACDSSGSGERSNVTHPFLTEYGTFPF